MFFFRFKSAVVVHLRRNLTTTAVTSAVIHACRINQMMSVSMINSGLALLCIPHSSESHHSYNFFSFRQICCHNSYFLCPMKFRDNNLVLNKLQSTKFEKKKRVTALLRENLEYLRIWSRKKEPITFLISTFYQQ